MKSCSPTTFQLTQEIYTLLTFQILNTDAKMLLKSNCSPWPTFLWDVIHASGLAKEGLGFPTARSTIYIDNLIERFARRNRRHLWLKMTRGCSAATLIVLNNHLIRFRMAGYSVNYRILNAANYGVSQQRRRIFIVGIRSDLEFQYFFPAPIHTGESSAKLATVKDALQGLPTWPSGEFLEQKFHWYYMSRNRRCEWAELSKTIVSNARHMLLHPISPRLQKIGPDKWDWATDGEPRRFSYREAARLQGFRHDWEFPGTDAIREKYRAIGNAVLPPLFGHIGESLNGLW